jgi:hypothetical protein
MTQIAWNAPGEKFFETGIDRGVLYVPGQDGVAWNGLVSVEENPSGGETQTYYIDGVKYLRKSTKEEYEATIEAYTYPDEFNACSGMAQLYQSQGLFATQQQTRKTFGFSYRSLIGNDTAATDHAYKIHIIYNALAEPSKQKHQTIGENAEVEPFSWDITTDTVPIAGLDNSAHIVIDTRLAWPWAVAAVEAVLYGTEDTAPRLPDPQELMDLFEDNAMVKVNLDEATGIITIEGPDEAIQALSTTEYRITWPSVVFLDAVSFEISSL